MTSDNAIGVIRKAISDVGQAVDLRVLEQLVRVADDLITDYWSSGRIDDEDLPDLKLELVVARRARLKKLSP